MRKQFLLMAIMVACCAPAAWATSILDTNFDGADPNDPNLINVTWVADAAITPSTTVESFEGHTLRNDLGNWVDNVAVDYNLNTDPLVPRGIVASFSSSAAIDLSELVIGHTHTTNSGGFQVYDSNMIVTLADAADSNDILYTDETNYSYGSGFKTTTYDLSGASLEAGKSYTITLTMYNLPGGGAYATWNRIILSDTTPPPTETTRTASGAFSDLNWDNGSPSPTLAAIIPDTMYVTAGDELDNLTITIEPGGTLDQTTDFTNDGTILNVAGGTYLQSHDTTDPLYVTGEINVSNGGVFTSDARVRFRNGPTPEDNLFTLEDGTVTFNNGDVRIFKVIFRFLVGGTGTMYFQTFDDRADDWYLDFETGTFCELTLNGWSQSGFENQFNNGYILVDGAAPGGVFTDWFSYDAGTIALRDLNALYITTEPNSVTAASADLFIAADNAEMYEWYQVGSPDTLEQTTGSLGGAIIPDDTFTTSTEGYYYCVASKTGSSETSRTVRVMTPRQVGHWKLDGDLLDSVTGSTVHHGSSIDPPVYDGGIDGQGLVFDGDPNYIVTIADSNEFFNFYPQGYTVSTWIKTENPDFGRCAAKLDVSNSNGFALGHSGHQAVNTQYGGIYSIPSDLNDPNVASGQWHLIVGTFDGTTAKVYVDGVLSNSEELDVSLGDIVADNTGALIFGRLNSGVSPVIGILDDIQIYNYAIDDAAIENIYETISGKEACLNGFPDYDLAGPEGVGFNYRDCVVDIYELAELTTEWLESGL